jgi:hypothetical protein
MYRFIFLAFSVFSACAPVYVPNVRNSPMFTKDGEFQASAQIGNGLEVQSAYAVTEHFGVMANFAFIDQSNLEDEEDYHRHQFFEGGAGYFLNNEESFFEVYVGYGRGKGTTFDAFEFFGSQSVAATGRYERYFIQPAFGLNKDEMNVAFAPRFSVVDFYEFSTEIARTAIQEKPKMFFEPAIIGRANFAGNHMYVTFQAGASLGMNQSVYFDRRTFTISGGLGLRLGAKKKLVSRL